jgi:hypothetical protein
MHRCLASMLVTWAGIMSNYVRLLPTDGVKELASIEIVSTEVAKGDFSRPKTVF